VLVVFHDDGIGGEALANMSFAQFHDRALALGLDVPTLPQTLDLCAGRIRLDVELKNASADEVLRAITNSRMRVDDYVLTSFNSVVLSNIRSNFPGIRIGLLTEDTSLDAARKFLDSVEPELWVPDCKTVDDAVLYRCEQLHIELLPWGVNRDDDMRRLLSAKCVTGVITDRTREALDLRRRLCRQLPDPLIDKPRE
jgi:glycerophosphoryl diester phosphodiesterase